jgi:hypothetical protein
LSFIGDIFGFGDKPKGTPGQVVDVTPPQFETLRQPLSTALSGAITGARQLNLSGFPSPTGPNVAPIASGESTLLNQILSSLTGPNPLASTSRDVLQQTLAGDFLRPGTNPFLQASIEAAQRPVIEAFNENVLPQLRSAFTQAGQTIQGEGSSPFGKALVQSGRDFTRTLGDISTRLTSENFARERALQQGAVGQAAAFSQGELQNLISGLQTQALPRLIEQRGIEAGTQEFNNRLNLLLQVLSLATGATAPGTVVIPPTGAPAQAPSDLGGTLQGIASILPFLSFCWVAREVYGADNPKWLVFREWMLTQAPKWLRLAYLKHGERIAAWLRGKDVLKSLVRRWMDTKVRHMAWQE